ncbi:MAG: sulfite exporter TauE/SafE family protein [Clostridiales bacterium]|jgi:uncharacterized membrane protein YfcA|nr:sulfite exporter TauE/SafE family protein [Clostridiales bacterium]
MNTTKKSPGSARIIAALFTGIANGLFGAGGGMLAVVALERQNGLQTDKAHATALVIMLPLTVISTILYLIRGVIVWQNVPFVALGMLPGSLIGAKLLGKLKSVWIDRIFCILMLAAGIRLLF